MGTVGLLMRTLVLSTRKPLLMIEMGF